MGSKLCIGLSFYYFGTKLDILITDEYELKGNLIFFKRKQPKDFKLNTEDGSSQKWQAYANIYCFVKMEVIINLQ